MNKVKIIVSILLIALIFAGCASGVASPEVENITDDTTVTTVTTVPSTTAQPTTVEPTSGVPVYKPDSNKTSSDIDEEEDWWEDEWDDDPVEKPVVKPSEPSKPLSTDDEATAPSTTAPKNPTADKNYKYIAITFDDGPHWELTYMFADKLAEYGGNATFFVVGNRVYGEQAKAMKYAYDMGNEIGVHGWTHEYYYDTCSDSRFKSELSKTAKVIKDVTGEKPLVMRPIGGGITSARVKSSGYAVVNWNVDSIDWQYSGRGYLKDQNIKTIYNNVMRSVDENDIVLFHEIYYNSYDAFCKVIDKLYKKGYRFVTVSQLLALDESDRGKYFYSGD